MTEGSKWFYTDGSKGSNETRFASTISSALSTVSVQTLVNSCGHYGKEERDVKADEEAMRVNIDTVMGTRRTAGQGYIFKGCDGQWSSVLWDPGLSQHTAFLPNVSLSPPRSARFAYQS